MSRSTTNASKRRDGKNRILIVDDNQANCELLDAYLADVDCEIAFAADGKEALAQIATFQPDLILLDLGFPSFLGIELPPGQLLDLHRAARR